MGQQRNSSQIPSYKAEWKGIPSVPDYNVQAKLPSKRGERVRNRLLFLGIPFLIIAGIIGYIVYESNSTHSSTSACLPASAQSGLPTLIFCSPVTSGNAAGPVGSHISLIGENFHSVPSPWIVKTVQGLSSQDISSADFTNCPPSGSPGAMRSMSTAFQSSNPPPGKPTLTPTTPSNPTPTPTPHPGAASTCFMISSPTPEKEGSFYLFSWIWNPPDFPTASTSYEIATVVNGKVIHSPLFDVIASSPPCIEISESSNSGAGSACQPAQQLPLQAGSRITISGANWLLNVPEDQVTITATCTIFSQSQSSVLFSTTVSVDSGGVFIISIPLNSDVTGTCRVTATNIVTPSGEIGNADFTNASDSLTFGEAGDTNSLTITVT